MEMSSAVESPEGSDWASATRARAQKNSGREREEESCDVRVMICHQWIAIECLPFRRWMRVSEQWQVNAAQQTKGHRHWGYSPAGPAVTGRARADRLHVSAQSRCDFTPKVRTNQLLEAVTSPRTNSPRQPRVPILHPAGHDNHIALPPAHSQAHRRSTRHLRRVRGHSRCVCRHRRRLCRSYIARRPCLISRRRSGGPSGTRHTAPGIDIAKPPAAYTDIRGGSRQGVKGVRVRIGGG